MERNERLNDVLIAMGRSMLQYAAEAWPWTGGHGASLRAAVEEQIVLQRGRIEKLMGLLDDRRWTIELGAFPDFTDLHYLSLDFVLPHLIENERSLVKEIERTAPQCLDDLDGAALLDEILAGERQTLARLEELSRSKRPEPSHNAA